MNKLIEVLKNTTIISLINEKPIRRQDFIFLTEKDTIQSTLEVFIEHQIEAIPIKVSNEELENHNHQFSGLISLTNLLKFILHQQQKNVDDQQILEIKLEALKDSKDDNFIQTITFIRRDLSLLHLLLKVWTGTPAEISKCKQLYTVTIDGKYEVITPLDFLRHLIFLNQNLKDCFSNYSAKEVKNDFIMRSEMTINWEDKLKLTLDRLFCSQPHFLLAIVDKDTGRLEGNLRFMDFLPESKQDLNLFLEMLRDKETSLKSYLNILRPSKIHQTSDLIILYRHFTIYDLIEKVTRLKIHHLWRVTQDIHQIPVGAVGIYDILEFLHLILSPYFHSLQVVC